MYTTTFTKFMETFSPYGFRPDGKKLYVERACAACSKNVKKKLMPKGAIQSRADFGTGEYGGLLFFARR
jgi:hypothetical protein